MSLTEEASKRRGDAAAAVIQNELDFNVLDVLLQSFTITSNTSDCLSKNEFKILVSIQGGFTALQKSMVSTLQSVSSAIAASLTPPSASAAVQRMVGNLNSLSASLQNVSNEISNFSKQNDFNSQYKIISSMHKDLIASQLSTEAILTDLHQLIFG